MVKRALMEAHLGGAGLTACIPQHAPGAYLVSRRLQNRRFGGFRGAGGLGGRRRGFWHDLEDRAQREAA